MTKKFLKHVDAISNSATTANGFQQTVVVSAVICVKFEIIFCYMCNFSKYILKTFDVSFCKKSQLKYCTASTNTSILPVQ